jgi:alkylation response protein AidB-like acyl-CoA dehydrogenase
MKTGGEFLTSGVGSHEIFTRENFNEEQQEFLELAKQFSIEEVYPQRDEIEKYNLDLLRNLLQKSAEVGFLGIDVPEEYGGLSLDKVTSIIVSESLSFAESASFNVSLAAHVSIGTLPIVFFGTPEHKKKYLPDLVTAKKISAYCLTEPTAGSDALSLRSTAVLSEDKKNYILNGTKQFITNGGLADMYIVFAKVNGEKFTAFIVDRNTPGVQVGVEEHKMGQKGASTCSVTFENVAVPVENVLHQIGRGAEVAFNSLNIGRFKLGAFDLGGCKVIVNRSVSYALERWQFGQPIAFFDAIKGKFADLILRTFALDSMIYRTAGLLDESISKVDTQSPDYFSEVAQAIENNAIECSCCKIYGSESLGLNADSGIQIYGGYGFIEEYPMARISRDARVERLYEGTNEINRQVITGYFLKKAVLEELPIREAIKKIPVIAEGNLPKFNGPLTAEMRTVEIAKSLALLLFNQALIKYGQDLMNHQQLGELLSNLFIDIYAMDSTVSRVNQSLNNGKTDETWVKIATTFCAEKIYHICNRVEMGIYSLLTGNDLEINLKQIKGLRDQCNLHCDIFKMKSEIAEDLYSHGEYRF